MLIQNSLQKSTHAEHNSIAQTSSIPWTGPLIRIARASSPVLHAVEQGASIGIQPDVQKMLHVSFAKQRQEMLTQPSSSNNARLVALDLLEERAFQPAAGGLVIRLTGKGLGGSANSPEWGELLDDDDEGLADRIKDDIASWELEVKKQQDNITSTVSALYEANQAVANQYAHTSQGARALTLDRRDELQNKLSSYHTELREAKEQVRYYKDLLRSLG
jgi:hypothetical protein